MINFNQTFFTTEIDKYFGASQKKHVFGQELPAEKTAPAAREKPKPTREKHTHTLGTHPWVQPKP